MRSVPEWIGRTDDSRIPDSVRDRIMQADNRCHLCSVPIKPTDRHEFDHVIALINGGLNRESNIRPAHYLCHKIKTALDVKEKAKVAAVRKKHTGITRPKQKIQSGGFPKSYKPAREEKMKLPPRRMFASAVIDGEDE